MAADRAAELRSGVDATMVARGSRRCLNLPGVGYFRAPGRSGSSRPGAARCWRAGASNRAIGPRRFAIGVASRLLSASRPRPGPFSGSQQADFQSGRSARGASRDPSVWPRFLGAQPGSARSLEVPAETRPDWSVRAHSGRARAALLSQHNSLGLVDRTARAKPRLEPPGEDKSGEPWLVACTTCRCERAAPTHPYLGMNLPLPNSMLAFAESRSGA